MPADPEAAPPSPEVMQEAIAEEAAAEEAPDAALEVDSAEPSVDAAGDGDGTPVVKRKTRRGSRGGKNRRKKPAAVAAEGETDADGGPVVLMAIEEPSADAFPEPVAEALEEPDAPVVEVPDGDSEAAGYVPMSEWLDDFDRR